MQCIKCDDASVARGLCAKHYQEWHRSREKPPCSIPGCDQKAHSRGWCQRHYRRWWLYGDPRYGDPLAGGKTFAVECHRVAAG